LPIWYVCQALPAVYAGAAGRRVRSRSRRGRDGRPALRRPRVQREAIPFERRASLGVSVRLDAVRRLVARARGGRRRPRLSVVPGRPCPVPRRADQRAVGQVESLAELLGRMVEVGGGW